MATYVKVWGLLFVLAAASYAVGYFQVQSQAGLIVAVLMHLVWERLALMYAILVPPVLLLTFIGIGALDGLYTLDIRNVFFGPAAAPATAEQR
jgi:cytochrome c oxidase subunit IV